MDYKLSRYSFLEEDQGCKEYKDDKGDWVKWEDVEPLLKAYLSLKSGVKDYLRTKELDSID